MSKDPDKQYFWKMSTDKRTIDVIVPLEDWVGSGDVVYRLGDDHPDPMRGPLLQLGYRYQDEAGTMKEKLIVNSNILNNVNRRDCFWTVEDMAGVKCISLTLRRPSMQRTRHDPTLQTERIEERLDPQTWDALLMDERIKPKVTSRVFLELADIDGEHLGRVEFGLFGEDLPKTVKNFRGLVTGEYEDADGNIQKSAYCLRKNTFHSVRKNHFIGAGNPGLDMLKVKLDANDLKLYLAFYEDFKITPKKVGKIEAGWTLRWGADLGTPPDPTGKPRREGETLDGNSQDELEEVRDIMRTLVKKGEGAEFYFNRPEWCKGVDVSGTVFPAENFRVPHMRRGMLSMDRHEEKDFQGSCFFVTLKEYPEMDKRWVCFGEVLTGLDVLDHIEQEYVGAPKRVVIAECGLVA
jgi:cyclophilin family peptidyl-prolyl cis-trans isomerase